jgi:hypothetical protein
VSFCWACGCADAVRGEARASDEAKRKEASATFLRLMKRRVLIEPS